MLRRLLSLSPGRTLIILALLALHAGLALHGLKDVGVTNDETAHLTAGYTYWKRGDYRLQPENGNLPQRWAALPLLATQPHLEPAESPDFWERSQVWLIADDFFFHSGNSPDQLLRQARTAMVVWPLGLCLVVFFWSRHLWGDAGGFLSLGLCVASPTILAHGPLVTSDMAAALCMMAATGAFWRALHHGGGWWVGSALATGLTFIAKFSCVLLVPVFLLVSIGFYLESSDREERRKRLKRVIRLLLCNAAAAFLTIWVAFGLRFDAAAPGMPPFQQFYLTWDEVLSRPGTLTELLRAARDWSLLPEAYTYGFSFVRYFADGRSAFLNGDYSTTGWWWFFPAAFTWKSTPAELLTLVGLVGAAVFGWRTAKASVLKQLIPLSPLLILAAVLGLFAITSSLNIGHRHILPLYPILFILAGALLRVVPKRLRWLCISLPSISLVASLSVAPHYLTYFNQASGGAQRGWEKLVDSSLDWGQGLPSLAKWLKENHQPGEPVYVSYFGSDSLRQKVAEAIPLAPVYDHYRPREFVELQPGLYCIGATMLQDVFSPMHGPWDESKETAYRQSMAWARQALAEGKVDNRIIDFGRDGTEPLWQADRLRFARLLRYLRVRRPDAIVANTTLVFRLSELELQAMIESPPDIVELFIELAQRGDIPGR